MRGTIDRAPLNALSRKCALSMAPRIENKGKFPADFTVFLL